MNDKLKYLYILTSDPKDIYYEQILLSMTSLRYIIPDSFIILLTDNVTAESLEEKNRNIIKSLINEIKIIDFPPDTSNKYKSRWLKTSMRKHITGNFLFLDCDTVIADKLIIKKNIGLGAVLDIHLPLNKRFINSNYRQKHIDRDNKCGFVTSDYYYFNSGVIYCKDIKENYYFFELWHSYWLSGLEKGIMEDQPSFSMANIKCNNIIKEIDGTWNCQLVRSGKTYIGNARIIHYYNSESNKKNYLFAKINTYENIKESGTIPLYYLKYLRHPRAAFYLNNNKDYKYFINNIFFIFLIFIFSRPVNYIFYLYSWFKNFKNKKINMENI